MDKQALATPYSDEWWFDRLWKAMYARERRHDGVVRDRVEWADILWSWYIGDPPCPEHQLGWQKAITQEVLRQGRASYAQLAVDSKLDRCQLHGFRTSTPDDDDDDEDGPEAKARRMMRRARSAFNEALLHASVMKEGYVVVGKKDPRTQLPAVTAEDPRNAVGITDPLDDTIVVAFMKLYHDEIEGVDRVHLTLPVDPKHPLGATTIRVYSRPKSPSRSTRLDVTRWTLDEDRSGPHPIPNRGTCVHKIVPKQGLGDFEPFLDLLGRINSQIIDRLWTSKIQVFRQRAIEFDKSVMDAYDQNPDGDGEGGNGGDPLPTHDEHGEPIDYDEIFSADPGTLWKLPIGARIWESTPTDLQGALLAVRDDVKEFAGVSRTPLYSLMPDAVQGSAEGASLAREGHVYKVESFRNLVEPVVLDACANMLIGAGVKAEEVTDLEPIWSQIERHSLQQRTDSAVKAKAAGVPWQGVMEEYLGLDPETVIRYKRFRSKDLMFGPEEEVTPEKALRLTVPRDLPPAADQAPEVPAVEPPARAESRTSD